jgi:hypothetical protein
MWYWSYPSPGGSGMWLGKWQWLGEWRSGDGMDWQFMEVGDDGVGLDAQLVFQLIQSGNTLKHQAGNIALLHIMVVKYDEYLWSMIFHVLTKHFRDAC